MNVCASGTSPPPPPPPPTGHPVPTEHDSSNARNELREIQAKQCSKKKQATVSLIKFVIFILSLIFF